MTHPYICELAKEMREKPKKHLYIYKKASKQRCRRMDHDDSAQKYNDEKWLLLEVAKFETENMDEKNKIQLETISKQAMLITAYEQIVTKQSLILAESEKGLKEWKEKWADKGKVVQELSRINFKQCSALAKFRKEIEERDRELKKKEKEIEKLKAENKAFRSVLKNHHDSNALKHQESNNGGFDELKECIEAAKETVLQAIILSSASQIDSLANTRHLT